MHFIVLATKLVYQHDKKTPSAGFSTKAGFLRSTAVRRACEKALVFEFRLTAPFPGSTAFYNIGEVIEIPSVGENFQAKYFSSKVVGSLFCSV